jgi:perosamine synthetase
MIPVCEPSITSADIDAVTGCMADGWVSSTGPVIERFEARWAEYCGRRFGVAVTNGTAALEVAVEALALDPGSEIILPSFTIISCATAILRAGCVPVVVDCDPETWCMTADLVAARITPRTRAIMPVHIYGHPIDMDPLMSLAERHGLAVIEDAAEVHGAEYRSAGGWRRCGSFGAASCFSFYANKIVTTGEGGMVLTDDAALAARLRSLRNLCFGPVRFVHDRLGHNLRLTSLQAALGLAQVDRIDALLMRKRAIASRYLDLLAGTQGLALPVMRDWARPVFWVFGVVLDDTVPFDAREFAARLRARGVDTRPFFVGMHEQPALRELGLFTEDSLPVTERIARRGLYLPSGPTLTDSDIERVAATVREVLA